MPTPISAFHDVAARYGNVERSDAEAVQRWFTAELPNLSPAILGAVLEELLTHDGSAVAEVEIVPVYPKGAPLPSLESSPAVTLPLLAAGWRELVKGLYDRIRGRSSIGRGD